MKKKERDWKFIIGMVVLIAIFAVMGGAFWNMVGEQAQLVKEEEQQQEELSREDVLRLNKIHTRFSQEEIEVFVESYMEDDHMEVKDIDITDEEAFEKLILAYDYSTRRNSKYKVIEREDELIDNGSYRYPALTFVRREPKS